MGFDTRTEFTSAQTSEKLTLVHVHASSRLVNWVLFAGFVYSKVVPGVIESLTLDSASLTKVTTIGAVVPGTFFHDIPDGTVYFRGLLNEDPATSELVARTRFFYSDSNLVASWDLTDTGSHVQYEGRILKTPGYKHKIGIGQNLTSLVGSGDLILHNEDGGFDDLYDTHFFENQIVSVYSWNRDLPFSSAKKLFEGRVTNKKFNSIRVTLTIKDAIFDLQQNVPQGVFDENDTVTESVQGNVKRWIYGRVDGLQMQSTNQIADGYTITGAVSGDANVAGLTGVGTLFLSEVSPGDTIFIGTQEFIIENVLSNTVLVINNPVAFTFSALPATLRPEIPTTSKNRTLFVAEHASSRLTKTVVSLIQLNRVKVSDTLGLVAGDFVEFDSGERIEIKSVAPNNIVVLRKNYIIPPTVSSTMVRQPIQQVYVGSRVVSSDDFTVTNTTTETSITLDSDVEFNLAPVRSSPISLTFTNGSRDVTAPSGTDLTETFQTRDFIRSSDITFNTFYEILEVAGNVIVLRTAVTEPTVTDETEYKKPEYIGDDSIVSADVLGRTEDGTPDGVWISTAAQAIKDVLTQSNITQINVASFTQGQIDNPQVISRAIPSLPGSESTTVKALVDDLNRSVLSSITLDNSLNIKYSTLLVKIDDDIPTITDREIKGWGVESANSNIYRNATIRYRFKDINRFTQEAGNSVTTFSSTFVENYIGTDNTNEIKVYLHSQQDAETRAHREVYFNRLSRTEINVRGDLRLEVHEIGDTVKLDFRRLYRRMGNGTDRQKILTVIGKKVTGTGVELSLSDAGNIYNSSSIITPNTAPVYSSATDDEKIKYGYITDTQGIVDGDEDSANIHLIS